MGLGSGKWQLNVTAFRTWMPLGRFILAVTLAFFSSGPRPVEAAQLAGVTLPDTATVGTTRLVLNGIGLRTYSVLAIHIYIAGLYLQQPSHDANVILFSPGVKLLQLHFVHDVSANSMRGAWRTGLVRNCIAPCKLSQAVLSQFLAALQPVRAGEDVTLVFKHDGLDAYYNGISVGHIADTQFTQLMLAVFIGRNANEPRLKRELLGN
jgi:Chalcone isomerase-like